MLTDLRNLGGMEADLSVPGARVVDVEDPLKMPFAARAGGAGDRGRMKSVPLEERSAQDGMEGRQTGKKLPGFHGRLRLLLPCPSHLYRCYTNGTGSVNTLCKKMFWSTGRSLHSLWRVIPGPFKLLTSARTDLRPCSFCGT